MHGELVVLAGAAAGVVSWAVATVVERSDVVRGCVSSLSGRLGR